MTLRLKLMAGLVALCALGLTIAGTASAFALRSYLYDRVDQQLGRAEVLGRLPVGTLLTRPSMLDRAGVQRALGPTDYLVEIRRPNGTVLRVAGSASPPPPATPLLDVVGRSGVGPSDVGRSGAGGAGGVAGTGPGSSRRPVPFTVVSDHERYRAVQRTFSGGTRVLVALPLRPVADTVRRLVRIELAVGAAVLAAVAALAWLWLTRGLRPLRQMVDTAAAIAGGDLDRRVPAGPPSSETGQLAAALNAMLGQIQAAFAARVASQEQVRRFAADASHELRTPLTSIRGYADLLRAGMVPPDEADQALRRIQQEAARMGDLVDDLLYLAHLDEQRPMRRAALDLADLVRDAVADLRAVAPDRPVRAELPASCPVLGDPDALRQLVGNLLTNARVHTPPDAAIEVRLRDVPPPAAGSAGSPHPAGPGGSGGRPEPPPGSGGPMPPGGAVLDVIDHGPGLPPEVADHVFDRFYRAADSRAQGRGGSGLGLSIVAATAQAHGGRVEVTSAVGAGSTFRLILPPQPVAERHEISSFRVAPSA
ncbi:signal transduction histidine kinase [Frankia torreyi]|uniref:histidine kinase n=1 Tax=Frankia torreyi TaxID=1856 RepID=A0A0D8BEV8_9ACTN|nr:MULTISPECIES: HAMP domain-containing sensor histidine kinase [Frankia]KJE21952.1 signal transduction histidine kinase [Frankia torreyi]KQM04050.1 signal transduction histidine kinase [Frankia sp. CpI1-P]